MSSPTIGFRNGDAVCRNITFDYTTNPQPAQPGIITADAQLLIGSVTTTPNVAMSAGKLVSPGNTVTIGYAYPNITLEAASGGGTLSTLTPDIGGVVNPVMNNINVKGLPILAGQTKQLQTSTMNIGTNNLQIKAPNCSLFIVDANPLYGTHTTIQSAVNDANLIGTKQYVFIRPGTYVENISLPSLVSLESFSGDQYSGTVIIRGLMTVAANVSATVTGIQFENPSGSIINMTQSAVFMTMIDCSFYGSGGTVFVIGSTNNLILDNCTGNLQSTSFAYFNCVGTSAASAAVTMMNCTLYNSIASTVQNIFTYTNFVTFNNRFYGPVTTSGACANDFSDSFFGTLNQTTFNFNDNGGTLFTRCTILSGTATAIIISSVSSVGLYNCTVRSANGTAAISGAGTLNFTPITFAGTAIVTTTTQIAIGSTGPRLPIGNGLCQMMSGSGNPNGTVQAPLGSIWMRSDVGAAVNNRAYVNINGGTSWTAFLTAT